MDELQYLIDLHLDGKRQGPGGEDESRQAIQLAGLNPSPELKIADMGCGTGASSLLLARELQAEITAVDFLPEFLNRLKKRAREVNLSGQIKTLKANIDSLPFKEGEFDCIWSEGAIYNIGFKAGLDKWRPFLKPNGILAVSEIAWLTPAPSDDIKSYWHQEYPEINTISAKLSVIETSGYQPLAHFVLPRHCWIENYYQPLEERFDAFLAKHQNSEAAKAIVSREKNEINLYKKYCNEFSYGFFIARKTV